MSEEWYPPAPPPGAVFLCVEWICGGCDRHLRKMVSADQPGVTIACPWCDPDEPAAATVTEVEEDDA